jgi:hypothetical protein
MIVFSTLPALAESTVVGDSQAKQAVPSKGMALLYVYRRQDGGNRSAAVMLNGKEVTKLSPLTFGLWNVGSGRLEIRVDSKVLALDIESGRIYFIELTQSPAAVTLRQVSYAEGRQQTFQSQLASSVPEQDRRTEESAPVAKPAPARSAASKTPHRSPAREDWRREDWLLSLKLASLSLSGDSQDILGATRDFDSPSSTLDIELENFLNGNLSVGGEYIQYSSDFSTEVTPGDGKLAAKLYFGTAKLYFGAPGASWRGYAGAGAGWVTADFSGALTGGAAGPAACAMLGLQWRHENLGVRAEYKLIHAETEDGNGEKVDASANGFGVGMSIYF